MRILPFIFLVSFVGCSDQSTKSTGAQTTCANPRNGEITQLAETTVGGILLEPKEVIDGGLSLLVPKGFTLMDEELLRLKYPSERRPTFVYTNDEGSINIAINYTKNSMQQSQLTAFHKTLDSMFRNLYPSATWFKSEIISINGREWLTLNLRTPAIDTEIRNIMVGTSSEGRLLLVSVNFTKELEEDWLEPAEAIVQSLQTERR